VAPELNAITVGEAAKDAGKQKRSFECDYGTRIAGFKLRDIPAAMICWALWMRRQSPLDKHASILTIWLAVLIL
jgi:hypothetical protein